LTKLIPALVTLSLALFAVGCGSVPFVAQVEPTATSTRAPRPTFTPKPRATPTETEAPEPTEEPEPTLVEEPTAEPEIPTATSIAPTRAATRPPRPTQPPQPTAPPAPQFTVNATSKYMCPQEGIFEVTLNTKKGRAFVEGQWFAAFDMGGRLLQDGAGKDLKSATYPPSQSTGSNCQQSGSFDSPNIDTGKLDVGDAVRQGINPLVIRFIRSETDLTPISPDFVIDFGTGGRYWIFTQSQ
jgi:hypothetical protein